MASRNQSETGAAAFARAAGRNAARMSVQCAALLAISAGLAADPDTVHLHVESCSQCATQVGG